MNETLKQIYARKSCRAFTKQDISKEDRETILNAALQAATAGNMTMYSIINVTDQALKDKLVVSCDNQPFIATAPMILVFVADYQRWYSVFTEYVEEVRKPGYGDLMLAMDDALIAAQNAVVAAESLGISSCYIGDILERYEIHREMFNLPKYAVPACMVVFGYSQDGVKNRIKPPRFTINDVVYDNAYDQSKIAEMDQMLMNRNGMTVEEISNYVYRFCKRKYNSDFSVEMSRSVQRMFEDWMK